MFTGANMVETVEFKRRFCVCFYGIGIAMALNQMLYSSPTIRSTTALICEHKAVPISTCLLHVLNKNAKAAATISLRLCKSQCMCYIKLIASAPPSILLTLAETPIKANVLNVKHVFCTFDRQNPQCGWFVDQL